ncbi:MAG: GNAT family N-acetyltransferase [Pseudomonadota bacterium]
MKFALYKPEEMSAELWAAFTDLRNARAVYDDPFFDPDFARLIGEVREDTRIGVAFDGDDAVGFWALHERPGLWARPIGGPFSDWHGPVLKQDIVLSPQAFLGGLGLAGMTCFGLMSETLDQRPGFTRVGANMTNLSMGWDAFIDDQQKRWPKHFKKMRRVFRNVERDFSEFYFDWDDKSDKSFNRTVELKSDQFARTGFHNVLKPEWAQNFLDRLRHFEGPRLRARLVSLYYDGQLASAELNLQSDKVMHGWLTVFDQTFSSYSPGNQIVQDVLEHMSSTGICTYDAGPGLDHYKRHYANYHLPVDSGILRGKRGSFAPSRIAGRVWRSGEAVMPGRVGELMSRTRRRMDQIALSEVSTGARLSGVYHALSQRDI